MTNKPSDASLEKAVKSMQLFLGSLSSARQKDVEKLNERITKLSDRMAKKMGSPENIVWLSIMHEAKRRGPITPIPGKDI